MLSSGKEEDLVLIGINCIKLDDDFLPLELNLCIM